MAMFPNSLRRLRDLMRGASPAVIAVTMTPPTFRDTMTYVSGASGALVTDGTKWNGHVPDIGSAVAWYASAGNLSSAIKDGPNMRAGALSSTGSTNDSSTNGIGILGRDLGSANHFIRAAFPTSTGSSRRIAFASTDETSATFMQVEVNTKRVSLFSINPTNTAGLQSYALTRNVGTAGNGYPVSVPYAIYQGRPLLASDKYEVRAYNGKARVFVQGVEVALGTTSANGVYGGITLSTFAGTAGQVAGFPSKGGLYTNATGIEMGTLACNIVIDETNLQPFYGRQMDLGGANGGARITLSGTFDGTLTGMFYGIYNPHTYASGGSAQESLIGSIAAVETFSKTGSTWTATVVIPAGVNGRDSFRIGLMASNDTNTLVKTVTMMAVGIGIMCYGQSNSVNMAGTTDTTVSYFGGGAQPFVPMSGVYYFPADGYDRTEFVAKVDNGASALGVGGNGVSGNVLTLLGSISGGTGIIAGGAKPSFLGYVNGSGVGTPLSDSGGRFYVTALLSGTANTAGARYSISGNAATTSGRNDIHLVSHSSTIDASKTSVVSAYNRSWLNAGAYPEALGYNPLSASRWYDGARTIAQAMNMPVGFITMGCAGHAAADLKPGTDEFDRYMTDNLAIANTAFEAIKIDQGETDLDPGGGALAAPDQWQKDWITSVTALRKLSRQPGAASSDATAAAACPVFFQLTGGWYGLTDLYNATTNSNANTIRAAQLMLAGVITNIYGNTLANSHFAGHYLDCLHAVNPVPWILTGTISGTTLTVTSTSGMGVSDYPAPLPGIAGALTTLTASGAVIMEQLSPTGAQSKTGTFRLSRAPGDVSTPTAFATTVYDTFHYGPIGSLKTGYRLSRSFLKYKGLVSTDAAGPLPGTPTRSGAVIALPITLNGATALATTLSGNNNLTGWVVRKVSDGTVLALSSVVFDSANSRVVLTLAADPGQPVSISNFQGMFADNYNLAEGNFVAGTYPYTETVFGTANTATYTIPMLPLIVPAPTAT